MLLSKENLRVLSNQTQEEQTKLDRILLYIHEQEAYSSMYKSPNQSLHNTKSCHSVSDSVSYQHTKSSIVSGQQKLLPQTKSFHLLQKFTSPNLEMNRITIKQNRPKLGLFNKGKSSAQATQTVPDIVFSESKFLKKQKKSDTCKQKKKQHSVSKFFTTTTSHTSPAIKNTICSQHTDSNQSIERILKECQDAPQVSLHSYSTQDVYEQVPTYALVKTPSSHARHEARTPTHIVKTPSSHLRHQARTSTHLGRSSSHVRAPSRVRIPSYAKSFSYTESPSWARSPSHTRSFAKTPSYVKSLSRATTPEHMTVSSHITTPSHFKTPSYVKTPSHVRTVGSFNACIDTYNDNQTGSQDTLLLFYKNHDIIQDSTDNVVDWQIESIESIEEEYDQDILNFWTNQYKRKL